MFFCATSVSLLRAFVGSIIALWAALLLFAVDTGNYKLGFKLVGLFIAVSLVCGLILRYMKFGTLFPN